MNLFSGYFYRLRVRDVKKRSGDIFFVEIGDKRKIRAEWICGTPRKCRYRNRRWNESLETLTKRYAKRIFQSIFAGIRICILLFHRHLLNETYITYKLNSFSFVKIILIKKLGSFTKFNWKFLLYFIINILYIMIYKGYIIIFYHASMARQFFSYWKYLETFIPNYINF